MKIKSIEVKKLFGKKNFKLELVNGKGIFFGENGSGKTTFLNLVYSIIVGDMAFSNGVTFDELIINFDDSGVEPLKIIKNMLWPINNKSEDPDHISGVNYFNIELDNFYRYIEGNKVNITLSEEVNFDEILSYFKPNGASDDTNPTGNIEVFKQGTKENDKVIKLINLLVAEKNDMTLHNHYNNMLNQINYISNNITNRSLRRASELFKGDDNEIIYLNVYRNRPELNQNLVANRAEQDLYVERKIITVAPKFSTVKAILTDRLQQMQRLMNNAYRDMTQTLLQKILDCDILEEIMLDDEDKKDIERLFIYFKLLDEIRMKKLKSIIYKETTNTGDYKIISNILLSTLKPFLNDYRLDIKPLEVKVEKFVNVVNGYLSNKKLTFDIEKVTFKLYIDSKETELVEANLSSGEKNIISIFANLIFNNKKKIHLLIDEPELSLSIQWQEKFIEDICQFEKVENLIVVTHSPYVVSDSLEDILKGFPNE